MSYGSESFPSVSQLWQGCILGTIAHAIWLVQEPDFAYEQSWDGSNYSVQDGEGCRGSITFQDNNAKVIGVFRDENSPRNPLVSEEGNYSLTPFFEGIPEELLSLANDEALQYVLEEYEGATQPIITTAFWNKGETLTAAEPWSEVLTHGASILEIQLMDTDDAIEEWEANYEMSPSQVSLMRSLFERKIATPNSPISLNNDELNLLLSDDGEGLDESRELLGGIGIIVP
jgi:hypothetical protein